MRRGGGGEREREDNKKFVSLVRMEGKEGRESYSVHDDDD